MNERFVIAPVMIFGILVLIAVLFAVIALLRNPKGRKIVVAVLIVGVSMFIGLFTLRRVSVSAWRPGHVNVMMPMGVRLVMLMLVFGGIVLIISVLKAAKNKKKIPILILFTVFLVPALLFFLIMPVGHVRYEPTPIHPSYYPNASSTVPMTTDSETLTILRDTPVEISGSGSVKINRDVPPLPPAYKPQPILSTPSIWQEGIAGQFTANVYPSKATALKALRPKIEEAIRKEIEGNQNPPKVVLFAGGLTATEIHNLMDNPDSVEASWTVESLPRNLQDNEISIAVNFTSSGSTTITRDNRVFKYEKGILEVLVRRQSPPTTFKAMVEEKPWLEDLTGYQSLYPNSRFAVGRSHSSATDEKTAELEAVADACRQVARVLWEMNPKRGNLLTGELTVNLTDIENRGMILDRFSQQLYGMAGSICRNALLIDLSPEKVRPLANAKFAIVAEQQRTWAKILLSFVGMAAVILLVYVFLNAATRGYYSWSLRIAAVILLCIGIGMVVILA